MQQNQNMAFYFDSSAERMKQIFFCMFLWALSVFLSLDNRDILENEATC